MYETFLSKYYLDNDITYLNINQSPFNVGLSLKLPEFTVEQVTELARRYELDWCDSQAVKNLMYWVGGQPYLIHQALYDLYQQKISLPELITLITLKFKLVTDLFGYVPSDNIN